MSADVLALIDRATTTILKQQRRHSQEVIFIRATSLYDVPTEPLRSKVGFHLRAEWARSLLMLLAPDRSKDIIISGGENISSLAIESALSSHPDVLECACIARPHEKWGERPHAYVVLKDAASWHGRHIAFEKELKRFSKGKLPGFATPEWVEVVEALEKTSTGKVQKHVLRAKLKEMLSIEKK